MPISSGPIVPNIVDRPGTFEAEAEAWTDWLANDHRTQLNALEANVNAKEASTAANATVAASRAGAAQGSATAAAVHATAAAASAASALAAPSTSATSSTSINPGLGVKVFAIQAGKAFAAGQTVVARSASEPRRYMVGTVASYSVTTLTITVTAFGQSPTVSDSADWVITFWGALPAAAKPGQLLRLNGLTPEWGDEGGAALKILTVQNLARDSDDASGANWIGSGTFTPNTVVGSDGRKLAGTLVGDRLQGVGSLPDGMVTFGAEYAPITPNTTVLHRMFNTPGDAFWQVELDPATGQIVSFGVSGSTLNPNDASCGAESLGGGWVRLWITASPGGSGTYIQMVTTPGTSSVAAGRIQVRMGRYPGLYVPTTTVALSGAGARKRNQLAYGKAVDTNLAWGLGTNSVRVGKALAPNGQLEATVYRQNSPDNTAGQFVTVEAGAQYTASIWAKQLSGPDVAGTILAAKHDPGTGLTFALAAFGGASAREWRRYSITYTHQGATISGEVFAISSLVGVDIAVWGAQVVKGPVPCNFIDSGVAATDGQHADIEARRTHLVDTTYASVDIAPPESMRAGDWFEVVDVGKRASVNPITVLPGGVGRIDGAAEPFVIDVDGWSGRFTFDSEKGLVIS